MLIFRLSDYQRATVFKGGRFRFAAIAHLALHRYEIGRLLLIGCTAISVMVILAVVGSGYWERQQAPCRRSAFSL
jgi:hypothetical protein